MNRTENVKTERRIGLYWKILLVIAAIWAVFFALSFIKSFDDWYVNHILPAVNNVVARIFDIFPFAVGEYVMYIGAVVAAVTVLLSLALGIRRLVLKIRKKEAKKVAFYRVYMKGILVIAVYFLWTYLFHWWIPYNGHVMGEEPERRGYTAEEYLYVLNLVGERFRAAQNAVPRGEDRRIIYPDRETAYRAVVASMEKLSERYPRLKGYYASPKAARCSDVLDWMGIGGFTYPFTMEITYNKYVDNLYWYTMVAHETAHYKGFYKENEGEFLGILAGVVSDDPIAAYSGCDCAYYDLFAAYFNCLTQSYGLQGAMEILKKTPIAGPDTELLNFDEYEAELAAEEAYAADDHPLQEYSDTAADVADTGWDVQENVVQENYYDDSTRLIMDYFLGLRQE